MKSNAAIKRRSVGMRRSGFTLIELLIVIGIIAILVALAVVVGTKVVEGGRARATADVIRVLDSSVGAYQLNSRERLPQFLEVMNTSGNTRSFPLIDARDERVAGEDWEASANPSIAYYTAMVNKDQSIASEFQQLDSSFVSPYLDEEFLDQIDVDRRPDALDIRDAWGRPLRFVHPAFHGGHGPFWDGDRMEAGRQLLTVKVPSTKQGQTIDVEFRRSYRPFDADAGDRKATWVGDADEGMTIGGRAYFYSAGEDGDPGTRANNVYSTQPRFPAETAEFLD